MGVDLSYKTLTKKPTTLPNNGILINPFVLANPSFSFAKSALNNYGVPNYSLLFQQNTNLFGTTTSSAQSLTDLNLGTGLQTDIPGQSTSATIKVDGGSALAQQNLLVQQQNETASMAASASVDKPASVTTNPVSPQEDDSDYTFTEKELEKTFNGDYKKVNTDTGEIETVDLNGISNKSKFESKAGGYALAAGTAGNVLQSFGKLPKDETVLKINSATDAAADAALQSGNPYAMMAGAAVKVGGAINRMTGNGGVDGKTGFDKFAASDAGFIFGAMNPDPLAQAAYWVNRLTAKSTPKFEVDQQLKAALGDAYAGAFNNLDRAAGLVGKYGGFSSTKRVKNTFAIEQARMRQDIMQGINEENDTALIASAQESYGLNNQTALNGGMHSLKAGKNGMKINNIDWAYLVLHSQPLIIDSKQEEPLKFEEGGQIQLLEDLEVYETIIPFDLDSLVLGDSAQYMKEGGSFNVIPEGALHKNKHNMEDAEGLTKKGIPVITEEDGKKVLLAEIEVNEIIFRLEVTEKLEELAKEGTDEAAIEAGKLLVKEILHNTLDNTGLIKETV